MLLGPALLEICKVSGWLVCLKLQIHIEAEEFQKL